MQLNNYNPNEPKPGQQLDGNLESLAMNNPEEAIQQSTTAPTVPDAVHSKPATSARKVAANRRNSLKSTGPTTVAGKKRVARNAIKHGFFSKYLLVQYLDAEDQAEYDELYAAMHAHYQPVGVLEEFWVERIVVSSWRLRRLLRAESGHISRALHHERQLAKAESEHSDQAGSPDLEPYLATDHLFVPSNGDLDKNLRYEVMINKQLNHAIAQLERLQAMRKAESVPRLIREERARETTSFAKQSQ